MKCIASQNDVQMEVVLSSLLMLQTEGKCDEPPVGLPPVRILDYGCGEGRLLFHMRSFPSNMLENISYTGVDLDHENIKIAKERSELVDDSAFQGWAVVNWLSEC
ncbi:MAG: class I SAM-dependent methyltransferase, partial [Methanothrix sp.]|nr:class I SAM-dependent methyltransferase [Methanothrix sp.]